MGNTKRTRNAKVNAIVNEILDEDEDGDFDTTQLETCSGDCDRLDNPPEETVRRCKCGVENSSRFSLRVMEAMRSLQRDLDRPSTCTAEDIVDYIGANYRSDGDLYAQVRTALRQVCSQGFVMELLDNEYHLLGPVAGSTRRYGCSYDCEGRPSALENSVSRGRTRIDGRENGACCCRRLPKKHCPSREESRGGAYALDRPRESAERPIFDSTRISEYVRADASRRDDGELDLEESSRLCGCAVATGARDDRGRREVTRERVERQGHAASPIAGPSRTSPIAGPFKTRPPTPPSPSTPAKKARPEKRGVLFADKNDEDASTEEDDEDCTCDVDEVIEIAGEKGTRRRPRDRSPRPVAGSRRNARARRRRPREDHAERVDEAAQRAEDGAMEENEEAQDAEAVEEDDDTEDSAYRELQRRRPRTRSAARERELKRWIRRCRRECERRGGR